MIQIWSLAAGAMLALQPAPTPTPPMSEALLDRFVAALPESQLAGRVGPIDQAELSRLNELNPGRNGEVEAVLVEYEVCIAPHVLAGSTRALRDIGRRLGETGLLRLIQFYEGPDFVRFTALSERSDRGDNLSEPEIAEMTDLLMSYPLLQFAELSQSVPQFAMQDRELVAELTRCSMAMRSSLARSGLRAN